MAVYLLCVLVIGLPVLLAEVAMGRATGKNPLGAVNTLRPKSPWMALGFVSVLSQVLLSFRTMLWLQVGPSAIW